MVKKKQEITKEGKNVLLSEETVMYLIDTSGSMADELVYGRRLSKIGAMKRALAEMFQERMKNATADRMGITSFEGQEAELVVDPSVVTHNHARLVESLQPGGNTPMYQAIVKSAEMLADVDGLARMVLISDGEPNAGFEKPQILDLVANLSEEYGLVLDCVGIGTPGVTSNYDEHFMRDLAKCGKGQFFPVDDLDSLVRYLVKSSKERNLYLGGGIKLLSAVAAN